MRRRLHLLLKFNVITVLFGLMVMPDVLWGQTNPTAQSLPYSQNFSILDHLSTTYPAGWQGWTISTSPGVSFNISAPTADRALTESSSASTTSGNVHNYNGKIGYLNIGSLDLTLALAIITSGKENISINYDIMTIRNPYDGSTNTRINEVTLQYRIGTSGSFTNLTGVEYQNNTTNQITAVTTPQKTESKNITLPADCNNQAIIQLRWASRQVSGVGSRPSFAIDEVSITGTNIATPIISVSTATLSTFTYIQDAGPSSEQIFTVSGSNLTDDISIAASTNFEISKTNGSGYATPLTFVQSGGTVAETTVYVRLKAGLSVGTYINELITASSTDADNKTVTCSGDVTAPPLYYRSKATGNWSDATSWESSNDGNLWSDASTTPTNNDNTISIRNNHTITINSSVTIDELIIESGGVLSHTTGTLTVANGLSNDISIANGGVFSLSSSSNAPVFNSEANCVVGTGGILRLTTLGMTGNGTGVNLPNFVYHTASILEYTSSTAFAASGVTFFPSVDLNTIPIFRITNLTGSPGGASSTVVNGILEANSNFTWTGAGSKTFRNGISGTGTMSQNTSGQWIISGTSAELGGTGELSLGTNGLTINNGSLVSISSIKTISGGIVINNGTLKINRDAAVTISSTLTNNSGTSGLVIESDAIGTGSLIHNTAGVAATVERYLTNYSTVNDNKYHFLSSPVSAQPIRPDFVANSPAANVDFYKFDEPTATWINTKTEANAWNTEFENNFVVGRGYLIAYPSAPETKSFTGGTLNSFPSESPLVINCTNTNSGGWNLIGNPFPSAIDWDLVTKGDGMDNALYYYDHAAANYRYYVQLESIGSLGSGSRYIPAMQGFMVHAKTSGTKTVSLHNGFRAHNGQAFYKSQNEINNLLTVKLHANGKTDEAYILYYDEATESFDSKYDAYKLFSYAEGMPQLYTINSDEAMLAINSLPTQSDVKAVVLGYKAATAGSQSMSFEGLDSFAQPGSLQLEDKLLGIMHTLNDGPYEFLSEAGTVNERFVLHFGAVGIGEQPPSSKLKAYALNGRLYFHLNGEAVMEVIDLQGRLLESAVVNGQGLVNRQMNQPAGVYVIRLTDSEGVQTAKVVVK